MLKRVFEYVDFDGSERKETLYFNLTKSEIMEMELEAEGGLDQMLGQMVEKRDTRQMVQNFKRLILKAYGEKSLDGKRFVKSDELSAAFSQTGAYDQLFMELISDADAAVKFVTSIIPSDLSEKVSEAIAAKKE